MGKDEVIQDRREKRLKPRALRNSYILGLIVRDELTKTENKQSEEKNKEDVISQRQRRKYFKKEGVVNYAGCS